MCLLNDVAVVTYTVDDLITSYGQLPPIPLEGIIGSLVVSPADRPRDHIILQHRH